MIHNFPYSLFSRDELIRKMNDFSYREEAFYVLIRYDGSSGYFIPAAEMNDEWIRISFYPEKQRERTSIQKWDSNPVTKEAYALKFNRVMAHIHRGDTFLINLTQPTAVNCDDTLEELYEKAFAPYKIWIRNQFLCFSPERFVTIADGVIRTFPMKGTIDATLPDAEALLLNNGKEKAEHATIVDLLRNDLSRVANQVEVTRYRYVDRIITHQGELLQVSSEIRGVLPADYKTQLGDIFFTLLPAGSISGAPKAKTLEIIQQAEGYDRGFYTGICGHFDGSDFDSAVMIRFLEQQGDRFVFKSGGGITFRSEMEKEFEELIQKVYVPVH